MIFPLLYWIGFPLLAAWLVIRWIEKKSPRPVAPDAAAFFARHPLEKKCFRAAKRGAAGFVSLGDYETQTEAVDAAYLGKEKAQAAGEKACFLVFNHKVELLQQVDS